MKYGARLMCSGGHVLVTVMGTFENETTARHWLAYFLSERYSELIKEAGLGVTSLCKCGAADLMVDYQSLDVPVSDGLGIN